MKTKIIFLMSFLVLNYYGFSQVCGTPNPQNYQKNERTKQERGFDKLSIQLVPPRCLNVFYHIVRESDGTGGIATAQLNNITDYINQEFNPHNLFFNSLGHNFIDNSAYLSIDSETEAENLTSFNRPDAINIYIVNNLWNVGNGQVVGTAVNIPSINLVINRNYLLNPVMPHELGHCLNLLHTHETARGVENINGSNCGTAGDLVCDTPADPRLLQNGVYLVDINCNYTGGGGYNPDTQNIMSYSRVSCLEHFTSGQEIRIRDAIFSEPILQNIIGDSCSIAKIDGDDVVCGDDTTVFTIIDGTPPYNWTSSSNVQILSGNGTNTVTVKAIDNQIQEQGFVQVEFGEDNDILTFDFWVGKPLTSGIVGPTEVNPSYTAIYEDIYYSKGSTYYVWEFPVNWETNPYNNGFITWGKPGLYAQNGYLYSTATNKCGESDTSYVQLFVVNEGGGDPRIIAYPNQADQELNVDLKNMSASNLYVYLYDSFYNLVYSGMQTNDIIKTINTLGLNEGTYYLHVYDGEDVEIKQIIINH